MENGGYLMITIRSQDKLHIVDVKTVSLNYSDKKQIIANYMPPENGENGLEYYEILGTYETKERAMEVLNEIANMIYMRELFVTDISGFKKAMLFDKNMTPEDLNKLIKQLCVYQMPEE